MSEGGGGSSSVGRDFIFFLGIIVVLFAVWVGSGGPSRPISFAGPYLRPIGDTATTAQAYGDPNQYQSIQGTSWIPWTGGTGTTNIPAADSSEYRDLVTLSRDTSGAMNSDEDEEYVVVQASMRLSESVSTAGWRLVSKESGKGVNFPAGSEVARSGRVNQLGAIVLRPGDQAVVTTGRSPVGVSFRENLCTGYLAERQAFSPQLMSMCPSGSQEFARYGEDEDEDCLSYVRSLPQCRTDVSYLSRPSNSCQAWVDDHLNYNGCIDGHANDQGFLLPTWRVYLGARDELWRSSRETILLLDARGKVIDALSY